MKYLTNFFVKNAKHCKCTEKKIICALQGDGKYRCVCYKCGICCPVQSTREEAIKCWNKGRNNPLSKFSNVELLEQALGIFDE